MSAPKWATGMRRFGPGMYIDDETRAIHLSESEMCEHLGVEANEENVQTILNVMDQIVREQLGKRMQPLQGDDLRRLEAQLPSLDHTILPFRIGEPEP